MFDSGSFDRLVESNARFSLVVTLVLPDAHRCYVSTWDLGQTRWPRLFPPER